MQGRRGETKGMGKGWGKSLMEESLCSCRMKVLVSGNLTAAGAAVVPEAVQPERRQIPAPEFAEEA